MPILEQSIRKHLKYNLIFNLIDGGFFGLGGGFGSMGTMLPLFVSRMTDLALLIGIIPAIHGVTWQLPQLFLANRVARLRHYRPLVTLLTLYERLPYLGLALVAFFLAALGPIAALLLTFLLILWQDLRAGLAYVGKWPGLLGLILLAMALNFLLSPSSSLLPLLVTKGFGGGAQELAWVESAFGVGIILGGVTLSAWGGFKRLTCLEKCDQVK